MYFFCTLFILPILVQECFKLSTLIYSTWFSVPDHVFVFLPFLVVNISDKLFKEIRDLNFEVVVQVDLFTIISAFSEILSYSHHCSCILSLFLPVTSVSHSIS